MQAARTQLGWWAPRIAAFLLVAALLAFTIVVTGQEDTTNTETALWTFILFAIGLVVSYAIGRQSIKRAASDVVRPQARGAARRLVTLGRGINGFSNVIELNRQAAEDLAASNNGQVPVEHMNLAFDLLVLYMGRQLETVADALEDWREFEPDIVNDLQRDLGAG